MSDANPRASIKLPGDFLFGEVRPDHKVAGPTAPPAPLGPLAAFVGDWVGNGFNTIFRPDNTVTFRAGKKEGSWRPEELQGIYVWFDANAGRLHFKDGTFWAMQRKTVVRYAPLRCLC